MIQSNSIAIARQLIEGIAGGKDPAEIGALFADNLQFDIQGDASVLPWIEHQSGRSAIYRIHDRLRLLTEPFSFNVEESPVRGAAISLLRPAVAMEYVKDFFARLPGALGYRRARAPDHPADLAICSGSPK